MSRDSVTQLRSENEVISKAIEAIKAFEGYLRALAIMRGDERYVRVAGLAHQMQQKFIIVANQRLRMN